MEAPFDRLLSVYSKMSSTVLTASKIVLPLTYAHWLKCIILGRTHSSLLAIAVDPILTSTLIRDISIQLDMCLLSFFSNNIIIAFFCEFDNSPTS